MSEIEELVPSWLTVPDIAERFGIGVPAVRQLVRDRVVIGCRRGPNGALNVPEDFFQDDGPVPALRGTLVVLADSGFDDEAAIAWLHRPDDSLPGRPIDQLRAGRKTEVRRRAQALAF